MSRPRNPKLLVVYEAMLAAAADQASELYYQGRPRRGASHRSAFWDGYTGTRSSLNIPGTLTSACYRAGLQFAKSHPGIEGAAFTLERHQQ